MADGMVDIPKLAESLAQQIRRLGPSVSVTHSGSAAGRSSYLRVTGLQDEIRVSDHAKGTFNSQFYHPVWDADSAREMLHRLEQHFGPPKTPEWFAQRQAQAQELLARQQAEQWARVRPQALREGLKRLERGKPLSRSNVRALQEEGVLERGMLLPQELQESEEGGGLTDTTAWSRHRP